MSYVTPFQGLSPRVVCLTIIHIMTTPLPATELLSRLNSVIDHTLLKPEAATAAIARLCDEALTWQFASVMVHPCHVAQAARHLAGSEVRVGSVVGFPLGQNILSVKLFEAMHAIEQGANELDMVLNIGSLLEGHYDTIEAELQGLAQLCAEYGTTSKVILETTLLDERAKRAACRLAVAHRIDFVKTSTGLAGGATVADVALLHSAVAGRAQVKASGGIRSLADATALLTAGATRLGTSAGVALMQEKIILQRG